MTNLNDGSRVARRKEQRARVVRSVLVPAFPEIVNKESQCRLCALVETAPGILVSIHSQHREGRGVRALETQTRMVWEARGETPVDHRTFDRHLKKHCDFSEVSMAVGETLADDLPSGDDLLDEESSSEPGMSPPGTLSPAPPPVLQLAAPRSEDLEAGAGDYFDMENVIIRLRARVDQLDADTAFVDEEGRVNTYGIAIWIKIISELRQALEALNRMRNSDRLIKAIVQAHTKRVAQLSSAPLINRFQALLMMLKNGTTANAILEVEKLASGDVRDIMIRAAEEAIRESCKVYKLQ